MFFRYHKIRANYSLIAIGLNIGTIKNINFPFGTNGNFIFRCLNASAHYGSRVIKAL